MWEGPAKTCLHVGRAGGPVSVLRHTLAGDHRSARSWLASTRWLAVQLCSNREWACARTPEPPTQRGAISLTGKSLLHAPTHSLRRVVRTCGRRPIRGCYRASVPATKLTPCYWRTRADARERGRRTQVPPATVARWPPETARAQKTRPVTGSPPLTAATPTHACSPDGSSRRPTTGRVRSATARGAAARSPRWVASPL